MDGSVIDLSKYRFESAEEDLEAAKVLLQGGKFKASVNRSYVKNGIFDKSISKMIDTAFRLREKADY